MDRRPRTRFTRLTGPEAGKAVELSLPCVRLGSSPTSDVTFAPEERAQVAPIHAKVLFHQGAFWLWDNDDDVFRTLVNGRAAQRARLADGDEVQLGFAGPRLRFETVSLDGSARFTTEVAAIKDLIERPRTAVFDPARLADPEAELVLQKAVEHALAKPVVRIGRDLENEIVLDHPQVSAFHAEVVTEGSARALVDKKSKNGTFVGPQRIDRHVLREDEVVRIGPFHLAYHQGSLLVYDTRPSTDVSVFHVTKVVNGDLKLLDDVSLRLEPGELVGLLGPSGAGKSTLLNALNGTRPATEGRVLVNGLDLYECYEDLKQSLAFVPQDDIIHPELTPERTLHYVSLLRLPADTRKDERAARIRKTLDLLELTERRAVPIHRLSGGQRKRVSIGVELLTEPRIVFLDEPTSGLDPALEAKMMVLFKELTRQGKTVVVTTHVMEHVDLFDKLVVLMKGKLAFYGTPAEAREWFGIQDIRGLYDRLATAGPDEWRDRFAGSPLHAKNVAPAAAPIAPEQQRTSRARAAVLRHRRSIGALAAVRQLGILVRRQLEILLRDRRNTALLVLQAPVVAGFIALAMDSPAFITFMLSLSAIWFGTSNAAKEIVKELPIYRRERMVNLGIVPYVLSKALVLLLLSVVQCALLVAIVAMARHLPGSLLELYGAILLSSLAGVATGLAISSFVETTDKATALVPLFLIPQVLFGGMFTPLTGVTGVASLAMPTRWSYDLTKRVVMRTSRDADPPLVSFAEKDQAELELAAIESHTRSVLARIDGEAGVASASCGRIEAARRRLEGELGHLAEHRAALRDGYGRAQVDLDAVERENVTLTRTIEKERALADDIRRELAELGLDANAGKAAPDPQVLARRLTPAWADAWRGRLLEAQLAYAEAERSIAVIESSRRHLGTERTDLEQRVPSVRRSETEIQRAKEQLEAEGGRLLSVAAAVRTLEDELKADARRVREIQERLTDNLRKRRFVYLHPGDSLGLDVLVLVAFCLVLGLATVGLQKLRDREG